MSWIQTYTGKKFFPLNPVADDIDIKDIAHALSMQCRYTGHCRDFYSVAEHSVRASNIVPPEDALWALLHDAAEAYLVDLARPVKETPGMKAYRDAEAKIMQAVCDHFSLPYPQPPTVTYADWQILITEKRDLMGPSPDDWHLPGIPPLDERINPWLPGVAEIMFLRRFRTLERARRGE